MKKFVYRDILGSNPRKREVSVEELTDHAEAKVSKKRICKYFVEEKYSSKSSKDLRNWIAMRKKTGVRKDCHILRYLNTETGENKIVCKVLGDFFAVWGNTAYKIVYINELRVQVGG